MRIAIISIAINYIKKMVLNLAKINSGKPMMKPNPCKSSGHILLVLPVGHACVMKQL